MAERTSQGVRRRFVVVARSNGNRFFAQTLTALSKQTAFSTHLVRDLVPRPVVTRKQEVIIEHAQILDAIDVGDADAARAAMRAHIDRSIARLLGR